MGRPRAVDPLAALLAADPSLSERLARQVGLRRAEPVDSPAALARLVSPHLAGHETERLVAVALDRRLRPIGVETLSVGNDALTVVCPRTILRWALTRPTGAAMSLAIAHNHPSGDTTPSTQDREVTRLLRVAAATLGIALVESLVWADFDSWTSLASEGVVPLPGAVVGYFAP